MNKYYLSVGAIFKNESHCIKEWIDHYLFHGACHFYLINDNSTDNFIDIIQPYIDDNVVTLFNVNEPYYLGRQRNLYNRHILPLLSETKWLLMVDLDEFVWSKLDINLCNILRSAETYGQLQIRQHMFGSNGYNVQPRYIVQSFTKRKRYDETDQLFKYFVNSDYSFSSLNIHHADFTNTEYVGDATKFITAGTEYFINNHYRCQSKEFWNNVKCTRGDSGNYIIRKEEHFIEYDINEEEDFDLCNQNQSLYI